MQIAPILSGLEAERAPAPKMQEEAEGMAQPGHLIFTHYPPVQYMQDCQEAKAEEVAGQ